MTMNDIAPPDFIGLILASAAFGQAVLSGLIVLRVVTDRSLARQLILIFSLLAILAAGPLIVAMSVSAYPVFMGIVLAALYGLPGAVWIYVSILTAKRSEDAGRWSGWHLAGPVVGLSGAIAVWSLPAEARHIMFVVGDLPPGAHASAVALLLFVLVLAWNVVSAAYVIKTLIRLRQYRKELRDLFSNNDRRELRWLSILIMLIVLVWAASAGILIWDNLFEGSIVPDEFGSVFVLCLVTAFAVFGLDQKQGYAGRELPSDDDPASATPEKYSKSALGPEQADRIAARLDKAMREDSLYLDPGLSLHKLAKHVGVMPNLVSQTLNQTINATFFDYVNGWRVEAALPRIKSGRDTVLTIALDVGFNSRSTFYSAFKAVTGLTPRAYRQTHTP